MPNTFTLISTTTVGAGGAASIDFTSIPQTYTDLQIVYSLRSVTADIASTAIVQFNGDTGNNYSARRLSGDGSAAASISLASGALYGLVGAITAANATSNTFGNGVCYIPNYTGSTAKSFSGDGVSETNGTSGYQAINAGIWSGTGAITSIKLRSYETANLAQYSTASLYGVKSGSGGATVS